MTENEVTADPLSIVDALALCRGSFGVLSAVYLEPEDQTGIRMMAWNPLEQEWVQYINNPLYAPTWSGARGLYPNSILGRWAAMPTQEAKTFTLSQHQAFMIKSEE